MWPAPLLVCWCELILNLKFLQCGCCGLLAEAAIDLEFVKEALLSTTYQSMEGTSVCWCLATHVSFPGDEWSYPRLFLKALE